MQVVLPSLSEACWCAILLENGVVRRMRSKAARSAYSQLSNNLNDGNGSNSLSAAKETLLAEQVSSDISQQATSEIENDALIPTLPKISPVQSLKSVDTIVAKGLAKSTDLIEFLLQVQVDKLWNEVMSGNLQPLEELEHETGGEYFIAARAKFLEEYRGALNIEIPAGWAFSKGGEVLLPNLMQRLTAFRVVRERRLGNWSGVGAGKTISALLAAKTLGAKLTVVVAANATLEAWQTIIANALPGTRILWKERGDVEPSDDFTVLLYNYESFQLEGSEDQVRRLAEDHRIEFICLDEMHFARQRTEKVSSRRRAVLKLLFELAAAKNPDVAMLFCSATPVINSLHEGKAGLELLLGQDLPLKTSATVWNAISLHQNLRAYGIRFLPKYSQNIHPHPIEIDGNHMEDQLLALREKDILGTEKVLLQAKLPSIVEHCIPGTLIYTHYKTGMVSEIQKSVEAAGFSVGVYSGDDKTGLRAFIEGAVDVLIGTVPVTTGVDGLQYRCGRLVVASLPWTAAEYHQLIGRLWRQGSVFDVIDVFIPQVVVSRPGKPSWSWDRNRMARIESKKTLADCAVDGILPSDDGLMSPGVLLQKAQRALKKLIGDAR